MEGQRAHRVVAGGPGGCCLPLGPLDHQPLRGARVATPILDVGLQGAVKGRQGAHTGAVGWGTAGARAEPKEPCGEMGTGHREGSG